MPLRKSPVRTPALLAANRANCLKSTGPRTRRGKARVCLNALKHGRHARRLPDKLVRAGYFRELALYSRIHSFIVHTLQPVGPFEQGVAAALAAKACCLPRLVRKTKPESSTESESQVLRTLRTRIAVKDYRRRVGLVFWVQRRSFPAQPLRRGRRGLKAVDPDSNLPETPGRGADSRPGRTGFPGPLPDRRRVPDPLEDGVRCWVHRLRKPLLEERIRYSLDHAGIHRPELEARHWRDWPELCRFWGTPNAPAAGRRRW